VPARCMLGNVKACALHCQRSQLVPQTPQAQMLQCTAKQCGDGPQQRSMRQQSLLLAGCRLRLQHALAACRSAKHHGNGHETPPVMQRCKSGLTSWQPRRRQHAHGAVLHIGTSDATVCILQHRCCHCPLAAAACMPLSNVLRRWPAALKHAPMQSLTNRLPPWAAAHAHAK
jgi:hypothetical protein